MKKGKLIIVGTGIRTVGQMTTEAIAWLKSAEKVFYGVSDPIAERAVLDLNPEAISLFQFYGEGKNRLATYREMRDCILESVRGGYTTCAAFYGHPGVFVTPSHEAIRIARQEGFEARMLPGISAEDCLFADLGIDPAVHGCQSFEATDFLMNNRRPDPTSSLVLWQIGVVGDWSFSESGRYDRRGLPLLLEKLYRDYPPTHSVVIYEAAIYPNCDPIIRVLPLAQLPFAGLTSACTLYVPPGRLPATDLSFIQRMQSS